MKETSELINALGNTGAQAIISFSDGFQLVQDIPDFIDEALTWPNAVNGLNLMKSEAFNTTPEAIEELFEQQRTKLLGAGLNPMLAGSIVTNLKGIYYSYASIVQSGQEPIVNPKS